MKSQKSQNGGYYAIKGFIYQFDKSILEILSNKQKNVEIEHIQDLSIDKYYIQVKYKESQKYSPSKIRPAICQLMEYFVKNRSSKFCLYCYFNDEKPRITRITEPELDIILGSDKKNFNTADKKAFVKNFTLEFSENFDSHFKKLLLKIRDDFSLKNIDEAIMYHAIFRSNLIDVATNKNIKLRSINFNKLHDLMIKNKKTIFEIAYSSYLTNTKYLLYLKKEYFTFKKINLACKERLFIIEIDQVVKDSDIITIINNIKNTYYRKYASPAPYICLISVNPFRYLQIKWKLWDSQLKFSDGTNFDGDKFRIDYLIKDLHACNSEQSFKLISLERLPLLFKKKNIDESFVFLTSNNGDRLNILKEFKEFYITQTKDIINIIT